MNKIEALDKLIKECQTIQESVIIDKITSSDGSWHHYKFRFPESTDSLFYEWANSIERFVFKNGDGEILHKIRHIINGIKDDLSDGNDLSASLSLRFNAIIDQLRHLKILYEENLSNRVFVVHGHSELLIAQTESFLHRLGFEPIILRNLANQGQTIIEKLESNTDVPFAIVLYTACDHGSLNDANAPLKPRARQNVVFEHGYLNAKLGRNRVCALVEDGVEYPGDLSGVVYIPIDPNGAWKIKVANEMKAAGLDVDLNKL